MGNNQTSNNQTSNNLGHYQGYTKNVKDISVVDVSLLFKRKLTNKELEVYDNVYKIRIIYLDESAYIYNLKNLKNLKVIALENVNVLSFYEELQNLSNLECLDMYNSNFTLHNDIIINNISKCTNLEALYIRMHIHYIPKQLLNLKKLKELVFYDYSEKTRFLIPQEIFNLEDLEYLEIPSYQNVIIFNNKMFIFKLEINTIIPENITELFVYEYDDNSINNLPYNLEILKIGSVNTLPINNLPFQLKKLIICNSIIEYKDYNTCEFIERDIKEDDIKLPFGCQFVIKKYN